MYYTGIDLHRKTSFLTTVDSRGQIVKKANLANNEPTILEYFLTLNDDSQVVIESTASWYWLYDLLTEHGIPAVISNPVKTKAIASARIKNDKLDSHMLAQLLRADLLATVHVSSQQTRQLKELLRHRSKLVRDTVRMKNRIHSIMAKNNFTLPASDLFGKKGLAFLSQAQFPLYQRHQVDTYLKLYHQIKEHTEALTQQVKQYAKDDPMAQLLMTIPGVGAITAMFMAAEIEDISRFKSYRHLSSYAGLVPRLDASADKQRIGRITKQGSPYLRAAMTRAATVASRSSKRWYHLHEKLLPRCGKTGAKVAVARHLLTVV